MYMLSLLHPKKVIYHSNLFRMANNVEMLRNQLELIRMGRGVKIVISSKEASVTIENKKVIGEVITTLLDKF